MHIQSCLISPTLQKHQFVRVYGALESLKLFAAGLFYNLGAARFVQLRQLGTSSRCRRDSYNQSNCHISLLMCCFTRRDVANAALEVENTAR
jgi:hypothetical protein